jgi:hypothetical protein
MSDDDDDDDYFATQGRKGAPGNDLTCEDTYQGSVHPDADGSKAGVNLGMAAVDFSDNSCSLTTPSREKRHRNIDKEPSETEKPSPKAKVPRVDPDEPSKPVMSYLNAVKGKLNKSENAKEEIAEVDLPPAEPAPADPPVVLRSRAATEDAAKSPQKSEVIDWDRRRETRQKQIEKAQDTEGYKRYKKLFPVPGPKDPRTPRADSRNERKAFDFELKVWKTFLHKFDNVPTDLADF